MTDKEILGKYPFLVSTDWGGNPMWAFTEFTALDKIPEGWKELVLQMAEDISKVPHDGLYFLQIKEKYGELRIYTANSNAQVEEIIDNYSYVSEFVCVKCGKPDVHFCNGIPWVSPWCEDCFSEVYKGIKYNEVHDIGCHVIPNEYKTIRFSKDGKIEEMHDIKEIVDRYRNRWSELHETVEL